MTEQVVHVWVQAREGTRFTCPECGEASPVYDHKERSLRHLDTRQLQTLLHAAVPRVTCATHGVRTVTVPWAERRSHFTPLFERLAIAALAVARRLGLTWNLLQWSAIVLILGGALLCYPFAKAIWLAADLIFRPLSEQELEWHRADGTADRELPHL